MSDTSKITGPISAIIVTLIVTAGLLVATGAVFPEPKTFATVNFDGGWKKIGVISQEQVFTEVQVTLNGTAIRSGTVSEVKEALINDAAESGGIERATFREGIVISADAGVEWIGSESAFKLTTDSFSLTSTDGAPIKFSVVIQRLEQLEEAAKANRVKNSLETLTYSEKSKEPFFWEKLLAIFG